MTSAFKTLPVIDISELYSPDERARRKVAEEIGAAARDSGFFYVAGHPISPTLRNELLAVAKTFFALPLETKMQWYIGKSSNHSGYVPQGEEGFYGQKPDRKEAFDVPPDISPSDPVLRDGKAQFLGPVQWPSDEHFKTVVKAYYEEVARLAHTLFQGFALALNLPETWFEAHLTCPPSQLRMIHYPFAADAPPDQPGIGAHTDYECFTILFGTSPGLEVMNGEGEWIDAPPIENAFVINIGDMLEAWTNGVFAATSHRVRKVKEERYSFPYFATCDYHTIVAPLPQFVKAGEEPRFKPLVSGDHLLAQTAQTFAYMKARLADGSFTLPASSLALSSFGQEARHRTEPAE